MLEEWDGSPYVQAIRWNVAVFRKQQKLAKRPDKDQLDDFGDQVAIGETMSALLREEGTEGSSVGEMMNSVMPEEQVMAVLGSLRSVLNTFCAKLDQIVFSAM